MEMKDTRSGFGAGLTELGKKNKNVVTNITNGKISILKIISKDLLKIQKKVFLFCLEFSIISYLVFNTNYKNIYLNI